MMNDYVRTNLLLIKQDFHQYTCYQCHGFDLQIWLFCSVPQLEVNFSTLFLNNFKWMYSKFCNTLLKFMVKSVQVR